MPDGTLSGLSEKLWVYLRRSVRIRQLTRGCTRGSQERVLVVGSGIGVTACVLGRCCARVLGIEKDAVKNGFALRNIRGNGLEHKDASSEREIKT